MIQKSLSKYQFRHLQEWSENCNFQYLIIWLVTIASKYYFTSFITVSTSQLYLRNTLDTFWFLSFKSIVKVFYIDVRNIHLDFDSSSSTVLSDIVIIVAMLNFLFAMKIYLLAHICFEQTVRWVIWMMALGLLLTAFS